MRRRLTIAAAALACCTFTAQAQQVITSCGASKGKGFYLEPQRDGWIDETISKGAVTFIRYQEDYDIILKDAMRTVSMREDGAAVIKTHEADDGRMTFVAAYAATHIVEVYQLTINSRGRGTLIWSSLKNRAGLGSLFTKGSVFVSECAR
jgi:hypothetical protein